MTAPSSGSGRALQEPPGAGRRGKKAKPVRFVLYTNEPADDGSNSDKTGEEHNVPRRTVRPDARAKASLTVASHSRSHGTSPRSTSSQESNGIVPHSRSRSPQVPAVGVQPKHPLAWASSFPNMVNFYNHNSPDYSGVRLYDERSQHPDGHKALLRESPLDFTLQVMLTERARLSEPDHRLVQLKSWTLNNINAVLQRPAENQGLRALTAVGALVLYDVVHEDGGGASGIHLKGVQAILQRFGPIDSQNFHTACVIRYGDSLHSYYQQKPRMIDRRSQRNDIVDGVHALRLAMQPTKSNLSEHRLKIHLMMSFGSPAGYMFFILLRLDQLVESLLNPDPAPSAISPAQARASIDAILRNTAIYAGWRNELPATIYSAEDQANHRDTFALIHLSALVLIHKLARIVMGPTAKAEADLDHHVQKSLMHLLSPQLATRSPEAILWALFVAAPFLEKGAILRQRVIDLVARLMLRLEITSWQQVRSFLCDNYFCAPLQEEACLDFWRDIRALAQGSMTNLQLPNRHMLTNDAHGPV